MRRPALPTCTCTRWRFGRHRRFVLLLAWLTFDPTDRRLPHTSHTRAMEERRYHGEPSLATTASASVAYWPSAKLITPPSPGPLNSVKP